LCGLPNVATFTFIDLDSYNTTNPFDELSNLSIECTGIGENAYTSTPLINTNSRNKSTNLNLTDIYTSVSSDKWTTSSSGSSFMVRRGDTLSFCVINFQSIRNKKTELHNLIISNEPDIILGNETHLDPVILDAEILPYNNNTA
jgi:hypothetical protein